MNKGPRLVLRLGWLLATIAVLLAASRAEAHPARTSAVLLDLGATVVEAELQLPLDQLGLALDRPLEPSPRSVVPDFGPKLTRYVAAHLAATTSDERPFTVEVRSMAVEPIDGADTLVVHATLRPPEGASTRAFTLRDDVILHRVVTHKIFVSVRRDFDNAVFSDHPEVLGILHFQRESLRVDRIHGSLFRGAGALFVLGVRHIAEGTDHLLFLLILLLPAPLLARRGRWREPDTARRSAMKVAKIVTAFTAGHSITLLLGAAGWLRLPGRPVEILIAASILVSAIHAIRPVFPGREPLCAAGFGLVHGLAFATVLADLGLDARGLALGLLAFNLGIEAMQLAVVLVTIPWLLLLRRSPAYAAVRVAGALVGAVLACAWIAERALGWRSPWSASFDLVSARGLLALGLLAALSIAAARRSRVSLAPAGDPLA